MELFCKLSEPDFPVALEIWKPPGATKKKKKRKKNCILQTLLQRSVIFPVPEMVIGNAWLHMSKMVIAKTSPFKNYVPDITLKIAADFLFFLFGVFHLFYYINVKNNNKRRNFRVIHIYFKELKEE